MSRTRVPELGEKMVEFQPLTAERLFDDLRRIDVNAAQGVDVRHANGSSLKISMVVGYRLECLCDPFDGQRCRLKVSVAEFRCLRYVD